VTIVTGILTVSLSFAALSVSIWLGVRATKISTEAVHTAQRNLMVTAYQSTTELVLSVDRVFMEHPRIRPYFYENRDVPHPAPIGDMESDRNLVFAVAEFVLDSLECIWDHNKDNKEAADRTSWIAYIVSVFVSSPVLQQFYRKYQTDAPENEQWYPSIAELEKEVRAAARTLSE
jgi:hypothetical protein